METGRHVRCDVAVTTVEPLLASLSHKSGHPSSLMTLIKPPRADILTCQAKVELITVMAEFHLII